MDEKHHEPSPEAEVDIDTSGFMTPKQLGLEPKHYDALVKTLCLLEHGQLTHVLEPVGLTDHGTEFTGHFNMKVWSSKYECGTVCCLGGTAELVGGLERGELSIKAGLSGPLRDLFYAGGRSNHIMNDITSQQAAQALRSYLTTGSENWGDVL